MEGVDSSSMLVFIGFIEPSVFGAVPAKMNPKGLRVPSFTGISNNRADSAAALNPKPQTLKP